MKNFYIYLLLVLLSIVHSIHIITTTLLHTSTWLLHHSRLSWSWIESLSLSLHWLLHHHLLLIPLRHFLLVTHHLLPILRITHVGLISLSFSRLLVVAYVSLVLSLSTGLLNLRLLFFGDQFSLVLFTIKINLY